MKNISLLSIIAVILFTITALQAQVYNYRDAVGKTGITLQHETSTGVEISFSIKKFVLTDQEIDGKTMKNIEISGNFLPNNEGAPNLPGFSNYIAIPQGATAILNIKDYRIETIQGIELSPAPRIPLDTEKGALVYNKNDKIYSTNAFYPASPFQISTRTQIRGIDAVMLGITPFRYNPVTKELLVYHDIELEIVFEGGTGHFGDDRLRSRWWDQIIRGTVLNTSHLPKIDYNTQRNAPSDSPDFEYIIITPDDQTFLSWADSIKKFRNRQGIKTGIVTTTDIGGNTVAAIETYVDNAYNSWTVAPSAVLLLGDYATGSGGITSQIYTHPSSYPDFVSDNRFADVTGNDLPDIVFARITANNAAQLEVMITKFLDYERNPPTSADFYDHPITALGWQTERWFQICSEAVGGYLKNVKGKNPVRINAIYDGNPTSDPWSTATNTSTVVNYFGPNGLDYIPATPGELGGFSGGTGTHVINAINDGSYMLQHRDHGGYSGWGEPAFNTSSINSLHNTNNELPFIFSINCQTGAFHRSSECFAEKFHRHTYNGNNSGALGIIAATEVSYSFVNDTYVWGVFDNMHPDFMPSNSTQFPVNYVMPAFGNAAGKHFLYQSNWPYNTSSKQITYRLFHHHGDAFMTVFTEVPQNLSVTHAPVLFSGETSFTVTADQGSLIALTVNDEIIETANGTGSAVTIEIAPQIPPSEMIVTVTKQNHYRYQSNVMITPPSGSYVVFDSYEINDYTDNNGNGQVDYGETIWLTITVKNVGTETANNITGIISSGDAFINITDNTAFFGDVPAGGTTTITDAYVFEAEQDIPDQHNINFTLTANDGSKSNWESYFSITANAPSLEFNGYIVNDSDGNNNGILDPGETAPVQFFYTNNGGAHAFNVEGILSSTDQYLTIVTTDPQLFGTINSGQSSSAIYTLTADINTPGGHVSEATMDISADFGISQQSLIEFSFGDYCYPTANCSYADGFTGFVLNDISNLNSGCSPNGYGDFLNLSTELEPGQTYTVQWQTGYSDQDACLWIDLNNNREFEDSERLITDYNLAAVGILYSVDFTIPQNVYSGSKRMRIRANWQNSSADPCANFTYGETEDYTIIINAQLPPVVDFTASETTILEGESINFTDLTTNSPTSWAWALPGGTPSTSNLQNPTIIYNTVGTFSVTLTATNASGSDSKTINNYITVVSLPGCATNIAPANGAINVELNSDLQWNTATNATGYKIFVGTNNPPTNIENGTDLGNVLTYDPAILFYQTTYFWKVVAYNNYGDAVNCETWSFTTEDAPTLPPACATIVSPANNADEVLLSVDLIWNVVAEADGYKISFGTDNPPTNIENETDLGNVLNYDPATLAYGTTYFWEIIAYNEDGDASGCETWSFTTEDEPLPPAHFVPVWISPYNPMTVFVLEAGLEDNDLQPGDEIGLFDIDPDSGEEICVGMGVLTEVLNTNVYLEIIASMNDGSNPEQANGFTPGNSMIFKYWSLTEGEIINISTNYPYSGYDEVFTSQGTAFVELFSSSEFTQTTPLQAGWNMISFMVEPENMDMIDIVQPLIDQDLLYKILDEAGGTVFHLPFPPPNGQWANTIGNMACTEGYYIKVNDNCDMSATGTMGNLPMQIDLVAGWNMIGYPCADPADAMNVVQPLIDAGVLYKVIDENGGTIFHLPFPPPNGQWANTIGDFQSGEGYYIKVSENATLIINEPAKGDQFTGNMDQQPLQHFIPAFHNNPFMPMHIVLNVNELLNEGDEVAVFDGEICVGAGVYQENQENIIIITCSADDLETEIVDGYITGNNFQVSVWDQQTNQTINNTDISLISGDEIFSELGTGIYLLDELTTRIDNCYENNFSISILPNPVNDHAVISYTAPSSGKLTLKICDIFGSTITNINEMQIIEGKHFEDFNVKDLHTGYYLLKYTYNTSNSKTQGYIKFIIIK